MVFPNKRAHHEIGHAPYVLIGSVIGFFVVSAKLLYGKIKTKR